MATPGSVTPSLTVTGSTTTSAVVSSTVRLGGGRRPGEYAITIEASVSGGTLAITQWTKTRR